jgi:hypothetical protein
MVSSFDCGNKSKRLTRTEERKVTSSDLKPTSARFMACSCLHGIVGQGSLSYGKRNLDSQKDLDPVPQRGRFGSTANRNGDRGLEDK